MNDKSNLPPLPRPTVKYSTDSDQLDEVTTRGMMSNPIYVGVPPYQRVVSDEIWVRTATELIKEQGAEQFLVNMLHMLKSSMVAAAPNEAIPEDYDGPWPDDDDDHFMPNDEWDDFDESSFSWQNPLEGFLFCSHDGLPMFMVDNEFMCVEEYLNIHIDKSPITDLITEPTLALVFQNGHTLPLLCPDCGGSFHADHNKLLEEINGLTIVDVDWDEDIEALFLDFDKPGTHKYEDKDAAVVLDIHFDSVRSLTCPHQNNLYKEE